MAVFNAPNKLPGHVPKLSSQQFDEGGQEKYGLQIFSSALWNHGRNHHVRMIVMILIVLSLVLIMIIIVLVKSYMHVNIHIFLSIYNGPIQMKFQYP